MATYDRGIIDTKKDPWDIGSDSGIDEREDPSGQFRYVAGGSPDGTSTGASIIGAHDPLAGLNAATPGLDKSADGSWTTHDTSPEITMLPDRGANPIILPGQGDNGLTGVLLALIVAVILWALS